MTFEETDIRSVDPNLPEATRLIEVHTAYGDATTVPKATTISGPTSARRSV